MSCDTFNKQSILTGDFLIRLREGGCLRNTLWNAALNIKEHHEIFTSLEVGGEESVGGWEKQKDNWEKTGAAEGEREKRENTVTVLGLLGTGS